MSLSWKKILISSGMILGAVSASAATMEDFEYHGYFRVGSGQNDKGTERTCFKNNGAWAVSRLGNECGNYGEMSFLATHMRGKTKSEPTFRSGVTLAYEPLGHETYEADKKTKNDINFVEMFIEAENLMGPNGQKVWVGKKFYREIDAHMMDFYYYAKVMGNGAGVDNIHLPFGHLALAMFIPVADQTNNIGTANESVSSKNQGLYFDARLKDVHIVDGSTMNFWLGHMNNNKADAKGVVGGTRFHTNFSGGFNDVAFVYGQDALSTMEVSGASDATRVDRGGKRWRLVEHATFKAATRLDMHAFAVYQKSDASGDKSTWYSVAGRPVYFFNDNVSLAFEGEYSAVDKDGASDKYTLSKLTIAPQISPVSNIWSRPVLRAYYSKFFWNDAAKGANVGNGSAGALGSYANATSASVFGVQGEVWF